jgi:hypothetical protein
VDFSFIKAVLKDFYAAWGLDPGNFFLSWCWLSIVNEKGKKPGKSRRLPRKSVDICDLELA